MVVVGGQVGAEKGDGDERSAAAAAAEGNDEKP
jgi:hypothetical protein